MGWDAVGDLSGPPGADGADGTDGQNAAFAVGRTTGLAVVASPGTGSLPGLLVPANTLVAGQVYRAELLIEKTGASATTSFVFMRGGTAGTVADPSLISISSVGTANTGSAVVTITATVRSVVGNVATLQLVIDVFNVGSTGYANIIHAMAHGSATIDPTVANYLTVSIQTGTTNQVVVQQAFIRRV